MKICGAGTEIIRQHFEKKMMELEKEKRTVQVKYNILTFLVLIFLLEVSTPSHE